MSAPHGPPDPPVLILRTWGIDPRLRYDMPPRNHGLQSARVLREMNPVQLHNAHTGMALAALQAGVPAEELKLMMVRMSRLTLEMAKRLMKAEGKAVQVRVDRSPLEPWMVERCEESEGGGEGGESQ